MSLPFTTSVSSMETFEATWIAGKGVPPKWMNCTLASWPLLDSGHYSISSNLLYLINSRFLGKRNPIYVGARILDSCAVVSCDPV